MDASAVTTSNESIGAILERIAENSYQDSRQYNREQIEESEIAYKRRIAEQMLQLFELLDNFSCGSAHSTKSKSKKSLDRCVDNAASVTMPPPTRYRRRQAIDMRREQRG